MLESFLYAYKGRLLQGSTVSDANLQLSHWREVAVCAASCRYAKELHAVVKEILRNIQDQSDWTVPVMIALGRQVYEVATRVELIYTRGTPVSAWTPRRRTAQLV